MPAIRRLTISGNSVSIVDGAGATKTFLYAALTAQQQASASAAETALNSWLATNLPGCQARAHVFSVNPIVATFGSFDLGLSIPTNWWSQ